MEKMVVGYIIDSDRDRVLLIEKKHPKWQENKLNGIGGHIEKNELSKEAMRRECKEETGIDIKEEDWHHICVMKGIDFYLHVYATWYNKLEDFKTMTDEKLKIVYIDDDLWFRDTIPNVKFLIQMAYEHMTNKGTYLTAEFIYPPNKGE